MWLKNNDSQFLSGTCEKLGPDADPILSLKKTDPVDIDSYLLAAAYNDDKIRQNKHLDRHLVCTTDCFGSYNLRSAKTLLLAINQYICHKLSSLPRRHFVS
jgi:hypothetical protein